MLGKFNSKAIETVEEIEKLKIYYKKVEIDFRKSEITYNKFSLI